MDFKSFLDSCEEFVSVEEEVNWLKCNQSSISDHGFIKPAENWILVGDRVTTCESETKFCDRQLVQQVLQFKNALNDFGESEIRQARSRSNPFEAIKGGIFQNRAAMKMANIDAVFDFIFTNPKSETEELAVKSDGILYFADVCGGPGGFSEYMLWRKKWEAKGFGFTLKCSNDFCLDDFLVAPSECLDLHYGVNCLHGDGDIYNAQNIIEFAQYVVSQTETLGVHVMVADGGFSVDGNENLQEVLSKQLYLCQCATALSIVREGGHFLCKLFDLYTPFSAGLVYLMSRCFKQISIHKPNSSRPANSERFLVCKWKRSDTDDVKKFLFAVNQKFMQLKSTDKDVIQLVPLDILKADQPFLDYLTKSNNALCQRQIVGLAKIAAYCKDSNMREYRKKELRQQCLEFWNVPDKPRNTQPKDLIPGEEIKNLIIDEGILNQKVLHPSNVSEFANKIDRTSDWMCVVAGLEYVSQMRTFYLGLGKREVFYWDRACLSWRKPPDDIELPRHTLLYGELVENQKTTHSQTRSLSILQVIDAIFIGGLNVSFYALAERRKQISRLCKSVNKPSRTDLSRIHLKVQYPIEIADGILQRYFVINELDSKGENLKVRYYEEDPLVSFVPTGIIIYKASSQGFLDSSSHDESDGTTVAAGHITKKVITPLSNFFDCFKSQIGWWQKKTGPNGNPPCGDYVRSSDLISLINGLKQDILKERLESS